MSNEHRVKTRSAFLIAILCIGYLTAAFPSASFAQVQEERPVDLTHRITINQFGHVQINETITVINNSTTVTPLEPLRLGYPPSYAGLVGLVVASGPTKLSTEVLREKNFTTVVISPVEAYSIPAGSNATMMVQMILNRVFRAVGPVFYEGKVALQPSLEVNARRMDIRFTLPLGGQSTFAGAESALGFERTVSGNEEFWTSIRTNVPPGNYTFRDVQFTASQDNFSLVDFLRVERSLIVSSTLSVFVRDLVRILNYGQGNLTRLGISFLDDQLKEVTVLPTLNPPLSARQTLTILSGKIDLTSLGILRTGLRGGQQVSLELEYRLPAKFIQASEGAFTISVPASGPVDGLAGTFRLEVKLPPGFSLVKGELSYSKINASSLDDQAFAVTFRPGIAWAAGDIVPVASAIFLIAFVALLARGVLRAKEAEGVPKKIGDFISAFEEKMAAIAALLEEFRSKGIEKIRREDIEDARRTLEEVRAKGMTRMSEARPGLIAAKPGLEKLLNEIGNSDREYDRAARDLFNVFEQYYMRRMKRETFEKTLPGYQKRVDRLAAGLTDLLNSIQREFER